MENRLVRKLESHVRLSAEDVRRLHGLGRQKVRRLRPREDIIREGERPDHAYLVLQGWACRYKVLEDGRRQIIAFLLPGDISDLDIFLPHEMDHSVAAITPIICSEIAREALDGIAGHPRLVEALGRDRLVEAAIQREWTVNLGQRTAIERVGHLLCELFIRLRTIGLSQGNRCEMPLTQTEIADATGLTPVHINRTLRQLRARNLIALHDKELAIPDLEQLKRVSQFNGNYLHLEQAGTPVDGGG